MSKPFLFAMGLLHFGAAVCLFWERNYPMGVCMVAWGVGDFALMVVV